MEPEALYRDLGGSFRILETDFKKYSVGFPIAAPVAALEDILARARPRPASITALRVRYATDWYKVIGDENRMPDLNLRHCLAVTILDHGLTFAASHDEERMHAPDVVALGSRIAFLPAEDGQDRFEARIEVDCDGRTLTARQGLHVLGRKDNPMTPAQVEAKARELFEMVLPPDRAARLIALCHALPQAGDIRTLIAATIPQTAR
jgi:2-methylcitrate dehydratase PrpD